MRLEKIKLVDFAKIEEFAGIHSIEVSPAAVFMCAKVLHDGIYMYYEVPDTEKKTTIYHRYIILKEGQAVPKNTTFVDVLDTVAKAPPREESGEPEEVLIIFPIYKLK